MFHFTLLRLALYRNKISRDSHRTDRRLIVIFDFNRRRSALASAGVRSDISKFAFLLRRISAWSLTGRLPNHQKLSNEFCGLFSSKFKSNEIQINAIFCALSAADWSADAILHSLRFDACHLKREKIARWRLEKEAYPFVANGSAKAVVDRFPSWHSERLAAQSGSTWKMSLPRLVRYLACGADLLLFITATDKTHNSP